MESVRPFRPEDRGAVRRICADTGFFGNPIDPVFADREAFADFFTAYYTDLEPESATVAVDADGQVVGYLLGCLRTRGQGRRQAALLLRRTIPRVVLRYLSGRYDAASRRFLHWFVFRAARETPAGVPGAAHFHVNLLPGHRDGRGGRRLIFGFEEHCRRHGQSGVFGQMQVFPDRRGEALFQRFGWRILERREVTKFRRVHPEPVYVATIFKPLAP